MKPYHTFCCLLALLLPPLSVIAQSNYKPGYVVDLKGDTLRGYVDYQEWDANPDAINFKKTLTDHEIKYNVDNAAAFGIDKLETFVKYSGPISTDQVNPDKLLDVSDRDTSFKVVSVFFKVIEKGDRLTLYSYKDDIKIRFFISLPPGSEPKELVFRLTRTNTEYTYRKQLARAALQYNELTDNLTASISRAEYEESDILYIVSKINHINKAEFKKDHYSGPKFNLFVGAAVNIYTTTPNALETYYAAGGRSYTSFGPLVTFGINYFANPATRRLQFRLELSGAQNDYKSFYNSMLVPYVPTEVTYNILTLWASPQVIYNFYNTDNFKIFAGAGFVFIHSLYSNIYFGSQNHDGSEADIAAKSPFYFNGGNNAFIVRAGVQFTRHLQIFGSVQSIVDVTQDAYFQMTGKSEQVGINYLF
jgi:hypothetical protein